jgi:hypothetical protein
MSADPIFLHSVICFILYCIYLQRHWCTLILNLRHELVFFKRTPHRANSKWRKRLCSRENFFPHGIRTVSEFRRTPYPTIQRATWLKCEGNRTHPSGFKVVREQDLSPPSPHASLQIVNKLIGNLTFPFYVSSNQNQNQNYCFYFDAGQLAISQYPEGPATGHLDTGFSWFSWVQERMLRWFPPFQVASTCFSCSPPDLNSVVANCLLSYHVKWPLPPGDNPTAVSKYYDHYYYY